MSRTLKPVAFLDLDGPILDVSVRHHQVYTDIVVQLGGKPVVCEEFWRAKRSKTPDCEILSRSGLPADTTVYQPLKLAAIESRQYLAFDRLQPETNESLRRIAWQYRPVLVTLRRSRDALIAQLSSLGIDRVFTAILSGPSDVRPGWETKCELIRSSGIPYDPYSFFAGDTETDILAGRKLGVRTIAVLNGIRNESILSSLRPDWLLMSLSDLPSTGMLE